MVLLVREAAGFEGLIVLGVIYFILNLLQKAGKKAAQSTSAPAESASHADSPTQNEGASLEGILREIERLKQQKGAASAPVRPKAARPPKAAPKAQPPRRALPERNPERGPLGRHSRTSLEGAEEVEDRTDFDEIGTGRAEVSELDAIGALQRRRERVEVDQDEGAESVVQRRLKEAEERNRPLTAADHQQFDARIRATPAPAAGMTGATRAQLRQALIWNEILGPPKSLRE